MRSGGRRWLATGFGVVCLVLGVAGAAWADPPPEGKSWRNLSPEERAQLREQMREEWRRLSPEEREALRQRQQNAQRQLQQMSPEERAHLRDTLRRRAHPEWSSAPQPVLPPPSPAPLPRLPGEGGEAGR
jgi:hypothetical protein